MGTYHMTLHVAQHVTPPPVVHHMTYQHMTRGTYDPMTLER